MLLDSIIGMEIQKDYLAMVSIQKSIDGSALKFCEIASLPPAESKDQRQKIIIEQVLEFKKKAKVKTGKVFFAFPREEAIFRFVSLPASAKENLGQVLEYELSRYIPFSPEEVYYDFQLLRESDESLEILLVAARKQAINFYLETLSLANSKPVSIEVSTSALFNAFVDGAGLSGPGCQAVLLARKDNGELVLISDGFPAYSRSFSWRDGLSEIKSEIQKAFDHFSNTHFSGTKGVPFQDIKPVLLKMGRSEEDWNALVNQTEVRFSTDFKPARLRGVRLNFQPFAVSYGAALKGLKKVTLRTNLLPKQAKKEGKRASLIPTLILAVIIGALGISWGSVMLSKEKRQLEMLNAEVDRLNPDIKAVEAMEKEIGGLKKNLQILEEINGENYSQLEILRELTGTIPEKVWLNRFTCGKGKVQIEGQAPTASDLIPILERSALFQDAKFPSPITKTPDGLEQFRIEMTIEGTGGEENR
ncbi:MAG: pilus assembly protein PilM [Pseudomonadota bacterium]